MIRWRQVALGIGLLVVLQLAAWFLYRVVEEQRRQRGVNAPFHYDPTNGPAPLDEIILERADGRSSSLTEAASETVVLHFWATWCAPCRTELPLLLDWADGLGPDAPVRVLLVSVDDDWSTIFHFFSGDVPARVVRDGTAEARRAYGVSTLPDTYILARGLRPIARIHGARAWSSASARTTLNALLREAATATDEGQD
jgi:thiol-disulfide isomerase/thioredoxin